MLNRVVALVGPVQEMYPVTCASAVFGHHGPDIPRHYDFRLCTERPGPVPTTMGADIMVGAGLEALADAEVVVVASSDPGLLAALMAATDGDAGPRQVIDLHGKLGDDVEKIDSAVHLKRTATELGLGRGDDRLRHYVEKIPGAGR